MIFQMTSSRVALLPLMIAGVFPLLAQAGPSAKEIMTKNEEVRKIQDVNSSAMLTTGGGGQEKIKQFTWWRKLTADRVHFNTLTRFHAPAEVRGEGILFLEKSADENEVLLYLPNFKKIRRVETQNQSGSFMASELSYSDISTPHVDDYGYKLLKEEACPAAKPEDGQGKKCWVIEAKPATDSIATRTGTSRTIQWIRQDNWMGVRAETFDRDGKAWKEMLSTEIKLVDSSAGKWMAHKVEVKNLKNQKFTVLQFSSVKVNAGIADSIFTQQNLMKDR